MTKTIKLLGCVALAYMMLTAASCKKKNEVIVTSNDIVTPVGPQFNPDSAYAYCAAQCEFGPRIMNSDAHERLHSLAMMVRCIMPPISLPEVILMPHGASCYAHTGIVGPGLTTILIQPTGVNPSWQPMMVPVVLLLCLRWQGF